MPGVLVDSPSLYFPFDSGNMILSGTMSSSFESSSCDPSSQVQASPFSLHHDFSSSPPSASDKLRDPACAQQRLPRSKLGPIPRDDAVGYENAPFPGSDLGGLPIPSPAKPYRTASGEAFVGSPVFSDINAVGSPVFSDAALTALQKFLPSNNEDNDVWPVDAFPTMDVYSCDDFRMYEFKVRRCMRGRSHDWTECPFAHPGEKARRRDPRRFHYSGTACPDFRKGNCKKGDACEYAHGVFECWLHPARYRTQPCKDGRNCRRRVCFFAHTVEQLRVLPTASTAAAGTSSPRKSAASPASYDGSPWRQAVASALLLDGASSEDASSRLIQKFMDQQNMCNSHGFSEEQQTMGAPRLLQKVMDQGYVNMSSSPTSTLLSHSTSPPPLSPPLSPPVSPPMSPDPTVLSRSRAVASAVHVQSPLSNTGSPVPAHRRHLNRLQSVPTISIPPAAADLSEAASFDDFSMKSPGSAVPSSTNELANYLQALQFRNRVVDMQRARSTPSTPQDHKWGLQQHSLRQCLYRNIPGTPDSASLWSPAWSSEVEPNLERVESGRDLRANFYGRIGKENGVGSSSEVAPDLGWVNELVK